MVYGKGVPNQLYQFRLLREYRRNMGKAGFSEAKALLGANDMEQARECAGRIVALTDGKAIYWRVKAFSKGLTHLRTGRDYTAQHRCWSGSIVRYGRASGWVGRGLPITC